MGRPKIFKVDVTDGRGRGAVKRKVVCVQTRIPNILAYRDTPGFAYLLLAANPDVPVSVLRRVLAFVDPRQAHPEKWMYERREFFKVPSMPKVDPGAIQFVQGHMDEPSWKIHKQLRERHIKCSLACVHRIWMATRYENS